MGEGLSYLEGTLKRHERRFISCLYRLFFRSFRFFSLDVLKINIEEYEDRAVIPFLRQVPDILLPRHMIMEYSERDRRECDLCAELRKCGYEFMSRSRGNVLYSYGK